MRSLLSIFAAFVLTATAADISGTWKAALETPNGSFDTTFKLKVGGDKLTGTTASQFGELPISEGKVDGDNVSFSVSASVNGNDFKLNYKGKVSGDELKLTVIVEGRDRSFDLVAKRVTS
jgi:hypothetical protein